MKCKHCGQEIKKPTNFDILKTCQSKEAVNELAKHLCKKCPFKKWCPDAHCLWDDLQNWLFEEAK
jgi:hypothetical protein